MLRASVPPAGIRLNCQGSPFAFATSISWLRSRWSVIMLPSLMVRTVPAPRLVTSWYSLTSPMSAAMVPSTVMLMSGVYRHAPTVAPLVPTSSCVENIPMTGKGQSILSSSATTAQPARSSNALPIRYPSPNVPNAVSNVIWSPTATLPASSLSDLAPISTTMSSALMTVFSTSSWVDRCTALMAVTPGRRSLPINTFLPSSSLSSMPPAFPTWRYPSLVIRVTYSPTSSMCAFNMTLGPGLSMPLSANRFLMESRSNRSTWPSSSVLRMAATSSSCPEMPRASVSFFSSSMRVCSIQLSYERCVEALRDLDNESCCPVDINLVGGLDGGVHVAQRNAQDAGGDTGTDKLQRVRISAGI